MKRETPYEIMIISNEGDPFMMRAFATEEILQSTMPRLRGKYTILAVRESRSTNPNHEKVAALRKRGMEISMLIRSLPYKSQEREGESNQRIYH